MNYFVRPNTYHNMRSLLSARLIPLFVLGCLFLYQCERPAGTDSSGGEAAVEATPENVRGYTSGIIARDETVYVFVNGTIEGNAADMIAITPETEGAAVITSSSLSFKPANGWAPGTKYTAIITLPGEDTFTMNFETPQRKAEVVSDGLFIPGNGQGIQVTGRVMTNDASTIEEITQLISARQGSTPIDVEVSAGNDSRHFTYKLSAPNRGSDPAPVTIAYDGAKAGFTDTNGELTVIIPASDDFKVESLVVSDTEDGALVARFSDAIDPKQDFTGLIRFPGNTKYTTRVNGNLLYIYPKSDNLGNINIQLTDAIQNEAGFRLGRETSWNINLGRTEPNVRIVGKGNIMPHRGKRLYTFEAIGLEAVQLEILKIYSGNVGQFLQENALSSSANDWSLRHVGTIVAQDRVVLSSLSGAVNRSGWSRYAIDLSKYIGQDAAAIYQVRIGFGMDDAAAGCDVTPADFGIEAGAASRADDFTVGFRNTPTLMGDYYGIHGNYKDFSWKDQDKPCMPAYYNRNRFISQNILSSNLGLIAKRNPDRSTIVFATDLLNAAPVGGVTVTAYDPRRQEVYSGKTDGSGRVNMTTTEEPAFIMAAFDGDVAYLDLGNETALSLSRFPIGGVESAGGIKGAFYAERGVWRPGDSVFLHFMLEDRQQLVPDNYPVEFTLTDAQGRVVERRNVTPAFGRGLYPLTFQTKKSDPTGNWNATVKVGGKTYNESLMIETVKPNRLSIDLELPAAGLSPDNPTATLVSKWLYGAPGSNLKATVRMSLTKRTADFPKWNAYAFSDPARKIEDSDLGDIFEGKLDEAGRATFDVPLEGESFPGPVTAGLMTKVFEPGGNFSIDNQRVPVDPYSIYAGIKIPEDRWGSRRVSMEDPTTIELAAVDPAGEGISGRRLTAGLYRVNWRYWWQDNFDNVARFNSSRHTESLETFTATTGGNGEASIRVKVDGWGRYLLRVCDAGGHCTGQFFYAGYNQESNDRESASVLRPVAEKEEVEIGEQVNISLPTSAGGKLLVSLETGAGSVEQFWVDAEEGQTDVSFTADERMVPTVYANITLLQPYEQTTNDRPVRLYGIAPIQVTDPATILQPKIEADDEWRPESTVSVAVSETDGKPMTYTLAVVDEGLLGLTRFRTPDPHQRFFAKEALSVRTFDLYKYVVGSLNGEFGKLLAIGGGDGEAEEEDKTANRFEPVVRHLGPFKLAAGKKATHRISLPNYVGAVRVMVVASGMRAYGSAGERIKVVQPLMVLPTLPRVLGPGETVEMPVNVFAMNEKVKNVSLKVTESEGLVTTPEGSQSVTFQKVGNSLSYFPITVGQKAGIARFNVSGSGNGEQASQRIEIDVRHPNEVTSRSRTIAIAPGDYAPINYDNFGVPGTRETSMELSALPAMQLSRHLNYLLRYPYGCVEQTTSPAFAQLYLDKVTQLTPEQDRKRRDNVASGLQRLRMFQTGGGGMAYWPGGRDPHPWASNYVLHFLVEAERAGFAVPVDLKNKLVKFQTKVAANWKESNDPFYVSSAQRQRDQAYRLFALAAAGKPEMGAMNRLKGKSSVLPLAAVYQLAAAYALAGQPATGKQMMAAREPMVKPYREFGYTFGSDVRDMAMILESQLAADDQGAAGKQAFRLAERISKRRWLSTQEAAFAFVAIGKLSEVGDQKVMADFTTKSGQRSAIGANTGIYNIELPSEEATGSVGLKNTGTSTIYATVIASGKPAPGEERATNENLTLTVSYTDDDGNALDVSRLTSGTDFIASYTVKNPGTLGMNYRQLALRSLLPSGWEVSNDRLDASNGDDDGPAYEYRDFRDDRVYTFFHLPKGKSKTFSLRMTATYPGRYYLPSQVAEAMYANDVKAGVKGKWVEVSK